MIEESQPKWFDDMRRMWKETMIKRDTEKKDIQHEEERKALTERTWKGLQKEEEHIQRYT